MPLFTQVDGCQLDEVRLGLLLRRGHGVRRQVIVILWTALCGHRRSSTWHFAIAGDEIQLWLRERPNVNDNEGHRWFIAAIPGKKDDDELDLSIYRAGHACTREREKDREECVRTCECCSGGRHGHQKPDGGDGLSKDRHLFVRLFFLGTARFVLPARMGIARHLAVELWLRLSSHAAVTARAHSLVRTPCCLSVRKT